MTQNRFARRPFGAPLAAPLVAFGLLLGTACASDYTSEDISTAEIVVPEVVDLAGLSKHLEPTGSEKALIVNFWATW